MDSIQPGLQMMLDRGELLKALRAFKRGDFSVRMPLNLTGIDGEIAAGVQRRGRARGGARRPRSRASPTRSARKARSAQRMSVPGRHRRLGRGDRVDQHADRRHGLPGDRGGARDRLGGEGRPVADHGARGRRPAAARRGAAPGHGGEHDGRRSSTASPREVSRVAREVGTEGKLGGQAQVPGVAGRVEGPHRQRELDGGQPHRPGAQHRRGDHRGGARATCPRRSRST